MAKVIVIPPEKASAGSLPPGFSGGGEVQTYLEGKAFPLQLHLHQLTAGQSLGIGPLEVECVAYVWHGEGSVRGCRLDCGSSLIVEKGRSITVNPAGEGMQLLVFAASKPSKDQLPGRHVHVLTADRVPRYCEQASHAGGLHADSDCPTCSIWLHENRFPPAEPLTKERQSNGVHAHSEDEIIFVTKGEMRLGNRSVGAGTALAIAADTLYGFSPGPEGLSFINFRAGRPGDIRFANGHTMSETGFWRAKVARPLYLDLAG